jgi:hypothetical protein
MDSISSRKQDLLHTGFQLKFIPEKKFPLEIVEYSVSQKLGNTKFKKLNFISIEIIFKVFELIVKKFFKKNIENNQILCSLKVVEYGNSSNNLDEVNFRYIVVGSNLMKPLQKSQRDLNDIQNDITGGNISSFHQIIPTKSDLFVSVLPVNFPVNIVNERSKLSEIEKEFFSDELLDYLLLCPIVYIPLSELQNTNP